MRWIIIFHYEEEKQEEEEKRDAILTVVMGNPPAFLVSIRALLLQAFRSRQSGSTKFRHQEVAARHGVVATDDGRCSRIGIHALREGGHAVDAAVAASLCLGVVSPASSGIGGGAFMLIRLAGGEAAGL
uniref:Gamma-glutamyltranspeptidase n=1 Tax=Salix viminalis TaxID=40686 RepID=A0A6N2LY69_SALVM